MYAIRSYYDLFFYPLSELQNPARHIQAAINWNQGIRRTPALDLLGPERPLLWGITYRLIAGFLTSYNFV